jgi:phospholipid/cholesterol/gamma-HCH transport system ATP-binding protein
MVCPERNSIAVQCEGIHFSYANDSRILNNTSLKIWQGESVVIFGKSGSGKTTLLKCIAGYLQPTRGQISINDRIFSLDLIHSEYIQHQYVQRLIELWQQIQSSGSKQRSLWDYFFRGKNSHGGYMVFADGSNAFSQLTVAENIHLVLAPICPDLRFRKELISLLLEITGLTHVIFQKACELSSGQLRRLCLAQGLAINPGILILDEPTNGLDFSAKSSFLNFIEELRQVTNITFLSVTHDLEAALTLADRLILFKEGQIIEELKIEQSHPRTVQDLNTPEFNYLRQRLINFLE